MVWWWGVVFSVAFAVPSRTTIAATGGAATAILIDARTGQSLAEHDADAPRPGITLSQLMLVLVNLEQASLGAFALDGLVTPRASASAVAVPPVRSPKLTAAPNGLTLHGDRTYMLSDLLKALVVSSSDTAAAAVAAAVAGSIPACVDLMNARAQRLGMKATRYSGVGNVGSAPPSGHDPTTARDLARLAQALLAYPQVLEWASLNGFPFDHGSVLLRNCNQLLGAVPGVDGLLVSSSPETGYSIVATAQRRSLRLVAVVLDAADSAARYKSAADMLEWGFTSYEQLDVVKKGDRLNPPIPVANGSVPQIRPVAGQTLSILSRRDEEQDLQVRYQLPTLLVAPVKRHQPIGELIVEERGALIAVIPVLSPRTVSASGMLPAAAQ